MKRIITMFFAVVLLFSVTGCGKSEDETLAEQEQFTFSDSTGATVKLPKKPMKVAILFSSYADIWVTAGGRVDITVGESVERGFADDRAVIVDPGTGHSTIDTETLVLQAPDLVIGTADYESQCRAIEFCRSIGIPSALFHVETIDDYKNVLEIFCRLNENNENYEKYGVEVGEKIEKLILDLPKNKEPKKILFIRAGSSASSTKAKNSADNFVCQMLKELGAVNIADNDIELTGTLSLETIIEENPDYLFISTMGDERAAEEYMNQQLSGAGWSRLSCVLDKHYCYLPKELFHYKPNAKWAEAYKYLIDVLYSEN